MYLIYTGHSKKHSAWNTLEQAQIQQKKMLDKGYYSVVIRFDKNVHVKNGDNFIK